MYSKLTHWYTKLTPLIRDLPNLVKIVHKQAKKDALGDQNLSYICNVIKRELQLSIEKTSIELSTQ